MVLNNQKWNSDTALEEAFTRMVQPDTIFPGPVWWGTEPLNNFITPHDLQQCVDNIPIYGLKLFVQKMVYLHYHHKLLIHLHPHILKIFFIALV